VTDYDDEGFGFGGREAVPCEPEELELAEAAYELHEAKEHLIASYGTIPAYTGQWSDKDYTAEAREAHYRAAERFASAIRKVCR
jgi:hypothetical protein